MSKASAAQPDVILNLDRPRRFRLDWNALCQLEKKLGKSAFRALDWNDPGLNDFTQILWGGLLSDDPTLTLRQLEDMMNAGVLNQIKSLVLRGVEAAFPETDDDAKKKLIQTNGQAATI
jgi:hypothetical protein